MFAVADPCLPSPQTVSPSALDDLRAAAFGSPGAAAATAGNRRDTVSPSALNALLASSRESIDGNVDMAAASPEATHHGAAAAAATAGANAITVTRRHAKTPRSCLKGARKQHMLGLEGTGVRFGSPQAAVFTRDTPAVSMTPLAKEVNIHTSPCYSLRADADSQPDMSPPLPSHRMPSHCSPCHQAPAATPRMMTRTRKLPPTVPCLPRWTPS